MARKILNFRAFLITAVSVTASIFCVYCYLLNAIAGLICGITVILVSASLSAVFIVKYIRNQTRLLIVLTLILSTILSVCAFSIGVVFARNWQGGMSYAGYCTVTGRVCAVDTQSGEYKIDLDELVLNGKSVDGILRITIADNDKNAGELVACGDVLQFDANLNAVALYSNGNINGSSYRTDIRYNAKVYSDDIVQTFGKPTAIESFLISIKKLLKDNMGEKYGNIAFSMLSGDKHSLNTGVFDYYSAAGLGHIMAVSGLHIGFFVLLLNLIMRKVSKKIRYPIIGIVLLCYTVLADFSPSIVRAVIMAFISCLGTLIGGRRDLLSSLMCAYSLILAVKPFYLFEAGFLLSFGALFGIAMFAGMIRRFLAKRGVHYKIGNAIGGSVSASIGILPAEAYFFKTVHAMSFLVNMILMPYISIVFISIVCFLPIAAIPGCGQVLLICKYIIMPLDYVAYGLSVVPHLTYNIRSAWCVFLCYPIMFIAGEYIMIKKGKTAIGLYSIAVCMAVMVVCAL